MSNEKIEQAAARAREAVASARRHRQRGDSRSSSTYGQEGIALAIQGVSEVMLAFLEVALYELEQQEKGEPE